MITDGFNVSWRFVNGVFSLDRGSQSSRWCFSLVKCCFKLGDQILQITIARNIRYRGNCMSDNIPIVQKLNVLITDPNFNWIAWMHNTNLAQNLGSCWFKESYPSIQCMYFITVYLSNRRSPQFLTFKPLLWIKSAKWRPYRRYNRAWIFLYCTQLDLGDCFNMLLAVLAY